MGDNSTGKDNSLFFNNEGILKSIENLPKSASITTYRVFQDILSNAPTNAYAIGKRLKMNYRDVHEMVRNLEHARLIKTREIMRDRHPVKEIVIPEEVLELINKEVKEE